MSRDFLLLVFSRISFPPALEYTIRTISNFFENSRRYSSQGAPPVSTTPVATFATNFPYDTGSKFATGVNDTGGKQWDQLSDCWQLKMNLKKKIYLYANSTTQRSPKEIIKIYLFEVFFPLPPVSTIPMVHLELRISPRIFKKIQDGPYGILWGWGKLIHKKTKRKKSRDTVPLRW